MYGEEVFNIELKHKRLTARSTLGWFLVGLHTSYGFFTASFIPPLGFMDASFQDSSHEANPNFIHLFCIKKLIYSSFHIYMIDLK
jgi:hypothetical protein